MLRAKTGEFGEDEGLDMAGTDIMEHPFGFRMANDRFTRYRLQMVDLFDFPVLGLGVGPGPLFVVLRAFASGLVFGGDPNPDAD